MGTERGNQYILDGYSVCEISGSNEILPLHEDVQEVFEDLKGAQDKEKQLFTEVGGIFEIVSAKLILERI